jgi:hypothetical protein
VSWDLCGNNVWSGQESVAFARDVVQVRIVVAGQYLEPPVTSRIGAVGILSEHLEVLPLALYDVQQPSPLKSSHRHARALTRVDDT